MQRITYRVKVSAQGARRRISYLLRPSKRLPNTKSNIVSSVTPTTSSRFSRTKSWRKFLVSPFSLYLLRV